MLHSSKINSVVRHWLYSLGFLSRIPVPWEWIERKPPARKKLPEWFPLAGLTLGILFGVLALVFSVLVPHVLLAMLLAGILPLATGAFHEDGFADVADAAGAYEPDSRLKIMKDSRIGTFGGLALIFLFGVRFAAFVLLLESSPWTLAAALVVSQSWSRWSPILMLKRLPYVSEQGRIAGEFVPPSSNILRGWAVGLVVLTGLLCGPVAFILIPAGILCLNYYLEHFFHQQFRGITGDCLGATAISSELLILTLLVCA